MSVDVVALAQAVKSILNNPYNSCDEIDDYTFDALKKFYKELKDFNFPPELEFIKELGAAIDTAEGL